MVKNPSFEIYKKTPTDLGELPYATDWTSATKAIPDFFHRRSANEAVDVPRNKMGKTEPRTGHGYAGIYAYTSRYTKRDFREYLQVALKQPMMPGERYCIKAHVYLSESSNRSVNFIGAAATRILLEKDQETPIELPHFKLYSNDKGFLDDRKWVEISGFYDAIGGERFLILGNFDNDKATKVSGAIEIDSFRNPHVDFAYYFVDDVCVTSQKSNFTCDCGSFEYEVNATREKIVLDFSFERKSYEIGQEVILDSVDFQNNKAIFLPCAHRALEDLVAILQLNPGYAFEISGHTSDVGDPQENQQLSSRRAKAVYDYLVASGISADRLTYRGYGQARPVALNDSPKGRETNERIQVKRLR